MPGGFIRSRETWQPPCEDCPVSLEDFVGGRIKLNGLCNGPDGKPEGGGYIQSVGKIKAMGGEVVETICRNNGYEVSHPEDRV